MSWTGPSTIGRLAVFGGVLLGSVIPVVPTGAYAAHRVFRDWLTFLGRPQAGAAEGATAAVPSEVVS